MDRFDLVTFVVQIFLGPFNLAKILSLRSKIAFLGLFFKFHQEPQVVRSPIKLN